MTHNNSNQPTSEESIEEVDSVENPITKKLDGFGDRLEKHEKRLNKQFEGLNSSFMTASVQLGNNNKKMEENTKQLTENTAQLTRAVEKIDSILSRYSGDIYQLKTRVRSLEVQTARHER